MKKAVIIGGGVGGLSAGIYGRKAGIDTLILEQHTIPGGLCTTWNRQGYTIDGCVHFIMGSGKGSAFHNIWKELGIFDKLDPEKDFVYHEDFFHFQFADGQHVNLSGDMAKLEKDLGSRFPGDAKQIRKFVKAVESLRGFEPPLDLLRGWKNLLKAASRSWKYAIPLMKWKNTTIKDFASGFKSPELREAFVRLWYPEYNMLYILLILDWLKRKLAGYPKANSRGFAEILEQKLISEGGRIRYGTKVHRIIVEDSRAVGVELHNGETIMADYIIHAAASPESVKSLLGFDHLEKKNYPITPPLVHLCFGSGYDFSDYESPSCGLQLELKPAIRFVGSQMEHEFLLIHIYNFAPSLSPEGKTLVKAVFPSGFDYWNELKRNDSALYDAEKKRVSHLVLEAIGRYFPGFEDSVEMIDVATPETFHRYTKNQEGSLIAWGAVPETPMMLRKTISGIRNLYLAGHWVMPGGGVPQAAMSARQVIQAISMDEGIRFDPSLNSTVSVRA